MNRVIDPVLHQNTSFADISYADIPLNNRVFIACEFISCNFRDSDLSGNNFIDCQFTKCVFSFTNMKDTGFRDAVFTGCMLMGIDFSKCNPFLFSFRFDACVLDHALFCNTKLKKTIFQNCSLIEADFEDADLTEAIFGHCNLEGARFVDTILEKTDFRTASNFSIDPTLNRLKKSKFSAANLTGLLHRFKLDIDQD